MSKPNVHVGIDVSKFKLDVCLHERRIDASFGNSKAGINQLVRRLRRYAVERIVVEATGGYERNVVAACLAENLPVCVRTRW